MCSLAHTADSGGEGCGKSDTNGRVGGGDEGQENRGRWVAVVVVVVVVVEMGAPRVSW